MLTIGFARRVPSYKRLTLMLRDPERLKRLLLHPERPIQLVIAGKAHPADDGGKKLIQEIVQLRRRPGGAAPRSCSCPNYDIAMAQPLYPGCDVWLNNPLRPYEACGTSGMKAALNGGLNLSILDGWWDEWYDGNNGWAIPSADGVEDPDRRDDLEAERALRPDRERGRAAVLRPRRRGRADPLDRDGAAHAEVARPQGARHPDGARLRPRSSTPRPPSPSRALNADYAGAAELAAWKTRVRAGWPASASSTSRASGVGDAPEIGGSMTVRAFVSLGDARARRRRRPGRARPGQERGPARRHRRSTTLALAETYEGGRHRFDGDVELDRAGPFGYTVRVLPQNDLLASPAELGVVALPA